MKLSPALPGLWLCFLVLQISQGEHSDNGLDECIFSAEDKCTELLEYDRGVLCGVDPMNILNCSWSTQRLERDAQLSVSVKVFKNGSPVDYRTHGSEKSVGSISWMLHEDLYSDVVVEFNVTLQDTQICCYTSFEKELLEIQYPPANITASIRDGSLYVTWDVPRKRVESYRSDCFRYQLDMGDQEKLRNPQNPPYMEPNVIPGHAYEVRMRTRISSYCFGYTGWSEWSPTVTVEQPPWTLNPLVIALITLGIPMILLAVLLFLHHQRLGKVLFPPIPRPPAKYKYFLEKSDPLRFFHPVSIKPEEEITEVEDAEQNYGTTT